MVSSLVQRVSEVLYACVMVVLLKRRSSSFLHANSLEVGCAMFAAGFDVLCEAGQRSSLRSTLIVSRASRKRTASFQAEPVVLMKSRIVGVDGPTQSCDARQPQLSANGNGSGVVAANNTQYSCTGRLSYVSLLRLCCKTEDRSEAS